MSSQEWRTVNQSGSKRVIVTKELPGPRWLEILTETTRQIKVRISLDQSLRYIGITIRLHLFEKFLYSYLRFHLIQIFYPSKNQKAILRKKYY